MPPKKLIRHAVRVVRIAPDGIEGPPIHTNGIDTKLDDLVVVLLRVSVIDES